MPTWKVKKGEEQEERRECIAVQPHACCGCAVRKQASGRWEGRPRLRVGWIVAFLHGLVFRHIILFYYFFFSQRLFPFFCKSMNTPVWMSLQRTLALLLLFCQCSASTSQDEETAVFAAGCFWSVELVFDRVEGVKETR